MHIRMPIKIPLLESAGADGNVAMAGIYRVTIRQATHMQLCLPQDVTSLAVLVDQLVVG